MLVRELEKAGIPAITGPNTLVLHFPASYNQAREFCQDPAQVRRVEDALRKTTGRAWILRVESVASGATSPSEAGPAAADSSRPPRPTAREEAEKVPLIKRAMEVFGVSISRVDEGFGALPAARPVPTDAPPSVEEP
jgi:hypothetical protein